MLSINDILRKDAEDKSYHVLWLDDSSDSAYVIAEDKDALPTRCRISELEEQLRTGELERETEGQPVLLPESEIPERDRAFRDAAWNAVGAIVTNEPAVYQRAQRGQMIEEAIKRTGLTKMTVYKYLRWYWQRGKVKNALLPNIKRRGGKGIPKRAVTEKMGRPRTYGESSGRNVDEATVRIFEDAVRRFYHTRKEHSFKAAYNLMLKEYYTDTEALPDGETRLVLKPQDEIPTLRQFRYWYQKTYDESVKLRARKGDSAFDRNHRAILGKSDANIVGPGSQYQIDATVGDIYLVSRFNRANIIGRPVIYFVMDTFSRMVTGMYVGLEGPSWAGAMMALRDAASDKVTYCAEYGIEIAESQWPCRHIPDSILADRGEMEGKSVETLINALNIRVDNAPPYRADMKGIIEQHFRTINMETTVFLPGYVKPDEPERGGHDYRLDAKLDLFQFTKIMIQCALSHNDKYMDGYERTEDMISEEVPPIPLRLWEWGVTRRPGCLRSVAEKTLKLCLMPTGSALVTGKGIQFQGLTYLSEQAIREHWFENARAKGSFRVQVSYDPRNMDSVYIWQSGEEEFEACFLPDWEEKYRGKSLDEIRFLQAEEKSLKGKHLSAQMQRRVDLNAEIDKIVREAEEMSAQTAVSESKSARVENIRNNRLAEKKMNRKTEAFALEEPDANSAPETAAVEESEEEETLSPMLALIKKKLEERLNET